MYQDKRFEVTGIVTKVGPDIHNKPSIEISNQVDGRCHVLCVFPSDEIYNKVSVGDKVVCKGNLQNEHLKEIQETAVKRVNDIVVKLKIKSDLAEDMKDYDSLYWVSNMNAIKQQAGEIVYNKIIYK